MKKNKFLAPSLIFLIIFILLAISVSMFPENKLDNAANLFSATHQTTLLQNTSIILSTVFEPIAVIIFIVLISIAMWIYKKKKYAILLVSTATIGGIFIFLLKHLFTRTRPLNSIIVDSGFSFPSGHALISTILFGILIYFSSGIKSQTKRIISITVCILGILLVGLSRVYLNVHWFSDVIAGYCFGLFILFGALFLYDFLKIKN